MDITTRFMGLNLSNPVIVSSSSLTATTKAVKTAVRAGAGAVVLKSLFEEDIAAAAEKTGGQTAAIHPEAAMYAEQMSMLLEPDAYLGLVEDCAALDVPIIASLNCHSSHWWVDYAERIAAVGADAIELNLSPIALDTKTDSRSIEETIVDMVRQARGAVDLPLAVKLGPNFSSLPHLAQRIENAGANALTLFNRFYKVDIDIESITFKSGNSLSAAEEFGTVLRWIGILSDSTDMDISASTGVYSASDVIKVLLAGGQTAQMCSVLYREGLGVIGQVIDGLQSWMEKHSFDSIEDFRSRLSLDDDQKNNFYQRLQYVKALKGE